jgi:hypothetical protein
LNLFEFAIAREFYRLMDLETKRTLTAKESRLMEALLPAVERIEAKETKPGKRTS